MSEAFRSGFIAIVGRPNVGKSTLLNRILGQKLSITSAKPQTTRHRILGIKTTGAMQAIYVDTPGLHQGKQRAINRYMNRAAMDAMADVDVVLFVVDGLRWTDEDQMVLERLGQARDLSDGVAAHDAAGRREATRRADDTGAAVADDR